MEHTLDDQVKASLEARKGDWLAIAAGSGVSYSWLSKFVNGHIDNPGYGTLKKLTDFLGVGDSKTVRAIKARKQAAAPVACPEARLLGVIGDTEVLAANAAIATVERPLSDLRERRGKERRGVAATGRDAKPSAAAEQGRAH